MFNITYFNSSRMSKDIRSFFQPKGKKPEERSVNEISKKKSKKRPIVIDSDSDEPEVIFSQKKKKKSSISDKSSSSKKQPEKLKIVDVSDIFGNEKIKRSAPILIASHKKSADDVKSSTKEFELIHSDDDFEATLSQIDEIEESALNKEQKINDSDSIPSESVHTQKDKSTDSIENADKSSHKLKVKHKKEEKSNMKTSEKTFDYKKDKITSVKSEISDKNKYSGSCEKREKEDVSPKSTDQQLKGDVNSPSDLAEKKRQQALSYMKYLQRGGPKHLGSKEIPVGKEGCLSGISFVITGVLDSLERDEATQLIEQYSGKVTSNVSRNTNYLICGDEAGNSKLTKAEKLGTLQISEDGLFDLIKSKSENISLCNVEHPSPKVKRKKNLDQENNRDETCKEIKLIKTENSLKERDPKKDKKLELKKLGDHSSVLQNKTELDSQEASTKVCVKNVCSAAETIREKSITKSVDFSNMESSLWVDKYKPTKSKQVIGQQGDRSSLRKLTIWLQNWHKNHSGNKKHVKPSPWAKNDDGSFFKAALLSGPPGIGKTTMAHLVSKELGFDVVEFNASDTRSKKLLHMEISELLSSKTLFGYFLPGSEDQKPSLKHVLLMDEVDGMAGNEDRGGVQELIQLIKNTRVPIICMCNDRNHPKIRSLANYCFDLRVMKPRLEQIRGAMMSVCYKEGLQIPATMLDEIICGANFDIRQILHHLSLWSAKDKQLPSKEKQAVKPRKDMKMGPWDVVKKVFSIEEHKTMSIHDKSNLFFHDYSINPLFVQENYLSVSPAASKGSITKTLQCVASAAESISFGEVIEKCIRSKGSWNLLPLQAMFSSVIPGDIMEGYIRSQINFPAWLGKNSRTNKLDRLLQELHVHTRLSTSGSKQALNMEYLQSIRDSIIHPLVSEGSAGVPETLNVLQSYNLLREDLESILELTQWPNQKDPMSAVESKVKAALTRAYNKEGILTPYSVMSVIKKRSGGMNEEYEYEDAEEGDDVEENNDISVDAMIKTKKKQKNVSDAPVKVFRGRGKNCESSSRGSHKRGRGRGK